MMKSVHFLLILYDKNLILIPPKNSGGIKILSLSLNIGGYNNESFWHVHSFSRQENVFP